MFPADITELQERGRENAIWERQEYNPERGVSREGWVSKRKASSSERMGEAKQPESWVLPLGGAGFHGSGGMGAVWSLPNPAFQKDFRRGLPGLDISVPADGSTPGSNGSPAKPRRVLSQHSCPALLPVCCGDWRERDCQGAEVLRGELTPAERSVRGQSWHSEKSAKPERDKEASSGGQGAGRPLTHKSSKGTMSCQPVQPPLDRLPPLSAVDAGAGEFLIEGGCPVTVGYVAACLASTLWMPAAPPLLSWSSTVSADTVKCPLGDKNHCRLRTAAPNQSTSLERRRGRDPKTEHPSQRQWFHPETPQHEETKVPHQQV